MYATPEISSWFWPLAALAVVLLACGLYFVRTGFAGRRRGDTPHCARCDYIVGGLDKLRCPECGADLNAPGAIVFGERPRRRGRGMFGLALVALGLTIGVAILTPGLRGIDWYPYRPTAWVIRDFKSADPGRSDRAWTELNRRGMNDTQWAEVAGITLDRYAADPALIGSPSMVAVTQSRGRLSPEQRVRLLAGLLAGLRSPAAKGARDVLEAMIAGGELDEAQHARLTELALAEQASPTRQSPEAGWLLRYLGNRELADALTDAQRERFYLQAHSPGPLLVRRTCVVGDPVPYRYAVAGRGPEPDHGQPNPNTWWVSTRIDRVIVDGTTHAQGGGSMGSTGFGRGAGGSTLPGMAAGKHKLEVVLTTSVHYGPKGQVFTEGSKPRWTREVTLSAEFEVLPAAPPGLLTWDDDPSLADAVRAALAVQEVRRRSPGEKGIEFTVRIDKTPVNVAFEVFGRVGGKEHRIATIAYPSGHSTTHGFGGHDFPPFPGDRIDLIFRSSDKALRGTVDMYHAWRGEIVFEDVKVTSDSP